MFTKVTVLITSFILLWNIFDNSESDYAVLTREFEDHVDEKVLEAVRNAASVDAVKSVGSDTTKEGSALCDLTHAT